MELSLALSMLCRRASFADNIFNTVKHICRKNSSFPINKVLNLDVGTENSEQRICIKGWVKSLQSHKGVMFMKVNDGTGPHHLQVVVPQSLVDTIDATFGSCVEVKGVLRESPGKGQQVELLSSSVQVIGACDPFEFPIKQKARHSPQYTRDYLHLRPKTNIFSALLRIRNTASMAVHSFFQDEGYLFIHTPVLVTNDCEGGCEVFKVEPLSPAASVPSGSDTDQEENDDISTGPQTSASFVSSLPKSTREEFFGQPVYLTVSGQLHLEVMTGALTKVYNFGPCFRAENSHGSFHLSEFYMVEAELAFIEHLNCLMSVMEKLVKHVYQAVMHECPEDVALFSRFVAPPQHMDSISKMMESNFERLTYTEAIQLLQNSDQNFKSHVSWGCDLAKEHEMYLTEAVGGRPVFVTDYPASLKPFYALRNEDGQTVSASDLLVPGVGELCGSSLREHRLDVLQHVLAQSQGLLDNMPWYIQLREFGSCPHGGFGLGFERLLVAILGASSVKDVIPFPRWTNRCRA